MSGFRQNTQCPLAGGEVNHMASFVEVSRLPLGDASERHRSGKRQFADSACSHTTHLLFHIQPHEDDCTTRAPRCQVK